MTFIRNKSLKEGMAANPLDKVVIDYNDTTAIAQEAILTTIAAETDAINQYSQIKELIDRSEGWFAKLAAPVIMDIISEEKKHLGQLTELMKEMPAYERDIKAGEEETKSGKDKSESVEEKSKISKKFDFVDVYDIVDDYYERLHGKDSEECDEAQHKFYRAIKGFVEQGGMIDAESVDLLLNKFIKDDMDREDIENKIIEITNYRLELDKSFNENQENIINNIDLNDKEFYSNEEILEMVKDKIDNNKLKILESILKEEYPNGMHKSELEKEILSDL